MQNVSIKLNGSVTFWSAGPTSRAMLERRLEQLGLEKFKPKQRTFNSALQNALKDYSGSGAANRKAFVASNKKPSVNGFSVIQVEPEEDRAYPVHDFSAKVDKDGNVSIQNGYADRGKLQSLFDTYMATLTGMSLGAAMTEILVSLGGRSLRPNGGVYWIPQCNVDQWKQVADACESASLVHGQDKGNRVYLMNVIMDDHSVRTVCDAVTEEINDAATVILEELTNGKEHKEEFYDRRKAAIQALYNRVSFIENELSVKLDNLRNVVSLTENAFAIAAMATMGV